MKINMVLTFLMLMTTPVVASPLTATEIERLRTIQESLRDINHKSLATMRADLEKTPYPSTQLYIKEAMAKTFAALVKEQNIHTTPKQEWLYSMINLNMAYLQFVGTKHKAKDTTLNMIIRQKLRNYLPADIDQQPGFIQSVD